MKDLTRTKTKKGVCMTVTHEIHIPLLNNLRFCLYYEL